MAAPIFMYCHGGSGNHGCEAIARSTISLFRDLPVQLYSFHPDEDRHYGLDTLCTVVDPRQAKPDHFSVAFWRAYLALRLRNDPAPLDDYQRVNAVSLASKNSIALSIGGDNYCYSDWPIFARLRAFLTKRGHRSVLWGCSVEPSMITKTMEKDLRGYSLIVTRESITYEALKPINPNTILTPDPAFILQKSPGNYPKGLAEKQYIGINLSPLVQRLEQGADIAYRNYQELVRHILTTTDRNIALIPHVVWSHNDDRIPLAQLYEGFKDSGRVFLIEDQNCMQLKDIISGCEFFIGARTHSTIAAYSTCVPTLVVGYSVKARGIARDLFGSEEGYVLPVQELRDVGDLTDAFKALYVRKEEVREHLTQMMSGYVQGIDAAREAVEKL